MNYFHWLVEAGVFASSPLLVIKKAFIRIVRNTRIKTIVVTQKDIGKPHEKII